MKPHKVAGPSGVSVDFLQHLASSAEGLTILTEHLNLMLHEAPLLDHRRAILILIPKLQHIEFPNQFRPIALMESIHKLFMGLLVDLQMGWEQPLHQMGAYRGSQVLDSLFLATDKLQRETLAGQPHIWFSADIEAAFDSVKWPQLQQALLDLTNTDQHPELHILLREIRSHEVQLKWHGHSTYIPVLRGVLQGGSHSSQLFAAMIEKLFQSLARRWDEQFPGQVRGWAYVDDCLFVFASWQCFRESIDWIQQQCLRATSSSS